MKYRVLYCIFGVILGFLLGENTHFPHVVFGEASRWIAGIFILSGLSMFVLTRMHLRQMNISVAIPSWKAPLFKGPPKSAQSYFDAALFAISLGSGLSVHDLYLGSGISREGVISLAWGFGNVAGIRLALRATTSQ